MNNINGSINYIPIVKPLKETYTLDKVAITPVGDKLELTPYENLLFANKVILWRVQDGEGYGKPDLHIDYGRWEKGGIVYTDPNKPTFNSSNIYWLYVTIADPANGGCIDYTAKFKISDDKKIKMIEVL